MAQRFGGSIGLQSVDWLIEGLRDKESDEGQGVCAFAPRPISHLELKDFRSFEKAEVNLSPVTLVHGANGSGKTSICEALELIWSGQTQRMPSGADPAHFARHLKREGSKGPGDFVIRYPSGNEVVSDDLVELTSVEEVASVPLGRTILAQHVLTEMASGSPKERFEAFLRTSGLALPELGDRIDRLRRAMYDEANHALGEVGIESMAAVNRNALEHLGRFLCSGFAEELMSVDELEGAADSLYAVSDGSFAQERPLVSSKLRSLLTEVDSAFGGVGENLGEGRDPSPQVDAALAALRAAADDLRGTADPLRRLAQQIASSALDQKNDQATPEAFQSPVPAEAVAQWLAHIRGVERSTEALEDLSKSIDDDRWLGRLKGFTDALRAALGVSALDELEALTSEHRPAAVGISSITQELSPLLLSEAGFSQAPSPSPVVIAALEELHTRLAEYAAHLDELASRLAAHPARLFVSRAARVMPALFRFELVRELTSRRGALVRAQETLVNQLLDERLFPVVQELVACLTRFEWYFHPLQMRAEGDGLHLTGLATKDPDLDIRFLLNEAERVAVGIAWFLALHVLQLPAERRVLVLDDPASGFDGMNKAAFLATLRAVVHLLEPEQLLITTHDDALAALLEQELAPVEAWPTEFGHLRCRRTRSAASVVEPWPETGASRTSTNLAGELRVLGLGTERSSARA
jgi:energy-coupling factor transporter ATP-binding protein EcfA2